MMVTFDLPPNGVFYAWTGAVPMASMRAPRGSKGERRMGLFRRKATIDDEGERCPRCAERVPQGASECAMCGVDLRPLRSPSAGPQVGQGAKR